MAFDVMGEPDRHDADVCIPAVHQNSFLDTGLPSHPLMDDEGSQLNVTPRNSRERGAARDPEKARSDLRTNTHAPQEHTPQLQAHLGRSSTEPLLQRAKLSDSSNEIVLEQSPYQQATASVSSNVGPCTRPVPVKTAQNSRENFVEVPHDPRDLKVDQTQARGAVSYTHLTLPTKA